MASTTILWIKERYSRVSTTVALGYRKRAYSRNMPFILKLDLSDFL
jgi:hypothetical protein